MSDLIERLRLHAERFLQATKTRPLLNEAADEIASLQAQLAEMREALEPFARFAEKFDAKPLRLMDDEMYGIHVGTEWEASLRLSDCRRARAALSPKQEDA